MQTGRRIVGRRQLAGEGAPSYPVGMQASAGLNTLTDRERERFRTLNGAYVEKFGFPFIMAVKGRSKDEILAA